MCDNLVGFYGVCASIFTGALFAQVEASPISGWENVSAIAILGMTMYFLLTRINERLDRLNDTIHELRADIQVLKSDAETHFEPEKED